MWKVPGRGAPVLQFPIRGRLCPQEADRQVAPREEDFPSMQPVSHGGAEAVGSAEHLLLHPNLTSPRAQDLMLNPS